MPFIKTFNKYEILTAEALNANFEILKGAIEAIDNLGITGCILPFAGTVVPEGWLLCDGSSLDRTEYSALFAIIGTKYGYGQGVNTFSLPDFRNRTFWGGDTTNSGTVKNAGLPNIKGSVYPVSGDTSHNTMVTDGAISVTYPGGDRTNSGGSSSEFKINFNASNFNSIYSDSINTVQPPAIQMPFIIKY